MTDHMDDDPVHYPIPVDAQGKGPADPDDMVRYVCWCATPDCTIGPQKWERWGSIEPPRPIVSGPHPYPGDAHVWHAACPLCVRSWRHRDSEEADAGKRAARPVWDHLRDVHGVQRPKEPMTAEQFWHYYAGDDMNVIAVLRARGRYAKPCACADPLCVGWQMAYPDEEG